VIKRLRFFCTNICCFCTRFYIFLYHSGTVNQVSWKLWMFLISTPHKTRTFTVRLAVTTKYQGNGFAAGFEGELWHFEYFRTMTVRQLLIFDHTTVTVVRICCCIPNFIKIGSRVRPPDAHNCWMSSAPLLGNGRCHGNPILTDMSGTWWDATSQGSFPYVHC